MSAPLELALREIARRVQDGAVAAGVQRVEVKDDGALVVEIAAPRRYGSRWFRSQPGAPEDLCELEPRQDAALPLVRHWGELEREGGIELLAWRPGRRIVLRQEPPGPAVILKGYRRRRSRPAYEAALVASASTPPTSFRVPAVRDHDPERACLVFEHLDGGPVDLGARSTELFLQVGRALRAFQEADAAHFDRTHAVPDELAVLDRAAERARLATDALPAGWEEGRAALAEGYVPGPDAPVRLVHRDLHDGQLLDHPAGPALLDFDLLARGDTALDPANLLAHLDLRSLQHIRGATSTSVRSAGAALLAGLGRGAEPEFTERLRFYLSATYLRLALVYALRPRWASLAPELTRRSAAPFEHVPRN